MTVIAWDGKSLAADKRTTDVGLARTTTKISRAPCGALLGGTGNTTGCRELTKWWKEGADPAKFPKEASVGASLIVITAWGTVLMYDGVEPIQVEEPFTAFGSGRDYAIAAMHLGKSAAEACEVASLFDTGCGNGVDSLLLRAA